MTYSTTLPRPKAIRERTAKQLAPIEAVFKDFSDIYQAIYTRRPDYYHYEESSGIMAIYVDSKIKVESGDLTRIKQRIRQLKDKYRAERGRPYG